MLNNYQDHCNNNIIKNLCSKCLWSVSQPTTTATTTTTLGPDDLVVTDYIIIGVTSLTVAGLLVGGIVYIINIKKK